MSELNTKDLNPEVWKLFDRYVHGLIDRRGFLDGTAKYAVGGMTANDIGRTVRAAIEHEYDLQVPVILIAQRTDALLDDPLNLWLNVADDIR